MDYTKKNPRYKLSREAAKTHHFGFFNEKIILIINAKFPISIQDASSPKPVTPAVPSGRSEGQSAGTAEDAAAVHRLARRPAGAGPGRTVFSRVSVKFEIYIS